VALADFDHPVSRPFGFLSPKDVYTIWLSNLLTLTKHFQPELYDDSEFISSKTATQFTKM
jgi:hypothetical protein